MEEDNPRHLKTIFGLEIWDLYVKRPFITKRFGDGHGILDRYMCCSFSGEIHRLLIVDIENVDIFSVTGIKLR